MPSGGARPKAGRPKGRKNRATIERELEARAALANEAQQARKQGSLELGKSVIERQMKLAEGMCARYQTVTEEQAAAMRAGGNLRAQAQAGDEKLYREWFKIWCARADEITKYQSPPVKAIDAPAPPPDPNQLQRDSTRRFSLRVFEGGKPAPGAANAG